MSVQDFVRLRDSVSGLVLRSLCFDFPHPRDRALLDTGLLPVTSFGRSVCTIARHERSACFLPCKIGCAIGLSLDRLRADNCNRPGPSWDRCSVDSMLTVLGRHRLGHAAVGRLGTLTRLHRPYQLGVESEPRTRSRPADAVEPAWSQWDWVSAWGDAGG